MKSIKVHLKQKGYTIVVGNNILGSFGRFLKKINCGNDAVIVTNPVIKRVWGNKLSGLLTKNGFSARFIEIADTEKSKSIKTCFELLDRIATLGRLKKIFIIAFGGGVVGDLSGFIAAVYKRGIPYVQLPTTLVAQVDSAIGGKVAIDLKRGKNLVGAFYQPKLVFSEIAFLDTLPKRQLINGLSEVIKYGVIKDIRLFEFIENNLDKLLGLDKDAVEYIITRSSQIKAGIVEKDEFDNLGIRVLLNYGHTIGHAIETASDYSKKYTHGEAISIGMIAANFISRELGLIPDSTCKRIEDLLQKTGLPTRARHISPNRIYDAHLYDKKFTNGKNRFVLSSGIGRIKVVENVQEKLVKRAIGLICGG